MRDENVTDSRWLFLRFVINLVLLRAAFSSEHSRDGVSLHRTNYCCNIAL